MMDSASRYLAWSIAAAVVLSGAGIFLAAAASRDLKAAQTRHADASQATQKIRQRYLDATRDEPAIRETIARFETLRRSGVIGPEHRLDWADRMRHITRTRQLPKLEFELLPQRIVRPLDSSNEYQLAASRMKIDASLLHEGDLLRLLGDLSATGNALVVPRNCIVQRLNTVTTDAATLTGECLVDWITIQRGNPVSSAPPRQ